MTSPFKAYLASRQAERVAQPVEPVAPSPLDRLMPVTFFADQFASRKSQETITLRGLLEKLKTTEAKSKAALPWLKLATFGDRRTERGSFRNDPNVLEISGIEADYDGEKITVERAKAVLTRAGIAAIIYTSPSHTDDTPRWRVLCPTSVQLPPSSRAALVARVNGLFVGALAGESFTLSQSYYYGKVSGNPSHEVVAIDGMAIDLADELDAAAVGKPKPEPVQAADRPARAHTEQSGDGTPYGRTALADECDAIRRAGDGTKHAALNKAGYSIGGLVTAGELIEGSAFAELGAALEAIRPYCKDFRAAQNTLRRSFEDGKRAKRIVPDRPEPVVEEFHPAAALIAKATSRVAKKAAQPMPIDGDIMNVDGILKELVDACVETAIRPQPFLALGAAICAIGALAGRRYRTKTDLRTNIYIAAICESGGGKDHPSEIVRRCLDDAGLDRYLGGETLASGRAVLSSLENHPSRLFQVDEFGMFLGGVTGKKAAPHKAEIWSEFMKLYSRAKGVYRGTEYANKKENPRIDIHEPCACFYGTTTPSTFWNAIEGGAMVDGSLARFLVFITDNHRPDRNLNPGIFKPSQSLMESLRSISVGNGNTNPGPGNLPSVHIAAMFANRAAEPYTVPMTVGADKLHIRNLSREDKWAREVEGSQHAASVNRLAENASKLALISAISNNPSNPVITERDVSWAWLLAEHCTRSFLNEAGNMVADSEYESRLNKAVNIIRKNPFCTKRDMFHKGFKLNERERQDAIDTLVTNGVIIEHKSNASGAGRPTIRYTVSGVSCGDTEDDEV